MPILFALLAGALSVLAYAPFGLFPLAPVCWAMLYVLLHRASGTRRAALLGWTWGLGAFFAGLCWLVVALNRFGGMPLPLAVAAILLFAAYLALYPALAAALTVRLARGQPWLDSLTAAGVWTLGEWLRGHLFTGFPWLALGYTQTPPSPLAGWAPIVGSYGLSFLLVWLAALAVLALNGRRWQLFAPAALVLIMGAALRFVPWTAPTGEPTRFALLQPNIAQDLKWEPGRVMQWLELNHQLVRQNPAQVVVLPETSLPLLERHLPPAYLDALKAAVTPVGGDVVFGVFTQDAQGRIYNSAVTVGSSPRQQYSKDHLVPFGEYSPPLFGWFYKLVNIPMSDQSRGGDRQPLLQLGGQRVAINICYEDLFGEEIIRPLPEATVLLNLSNLAWYGDSHAQPQHLQIARMRAMETGRPMLRSTNTGMTAAIAPDGTVLQALPAFTQGAIHLEVQGYTGMTPYGRWGNWPVLIASLGLLASAWVRRRLP